MKLTKNFNLSEFDCKDGTPVPPELMQNVLELAEQLQILRDFIGKPIRINSGYRTPAHNKKIGGSPLSQHLQAKAADIKIDGIRPSEVYSIVLKLINDGKLDIGGVGRYVSFTHLDTRNYSARWNG